MPTIAEISSEIQFCGSILTIKYVLSSVQNNSLKTVLKSCALNKCVWTKNVWRFYSNDAVTVIPITALYQTKKSIKWKDCHSKRK